MGITHQIRLGTRSRQSFEELQDPFFKDKARITSLCIRNHDGVSIRDYGTVRVPLFIAYLACDEPDTNACGRLLAERRLD